MPTSCPKQIPSVLQALLDIKPAPRTLLDVGFGCGKYGVLAREYLTVWDHYFEPWGSVPLRLTGIEIHEQYVGAIARATYDEIRVGNALEVVPTLGRYDACLLIDTLEHFSHEDGGRLLSLLAERSKRTIVAIPAIFRPTLKVWDNPHEVHQCTWTPEELTAYGIVQVFRHDAALVVRIDHDEVPQ
jgi:hypothetical protein